MEKLLTVIIPSYNMEKYLEKNLNTLLVREELKQYIEVLIINDGSKDQTSKIAHTFADQYPGFFIAIDKENGNYGSCINKGLELAAGKYVKTLDADDAYITSGFEKLIEGVLESEKKNENVDMFLNEYEARDEAGKLLFRKAPVIEPEKVFSFPEEIGAEYMKNICHHFITYRTSLLRDMGYRQSEGISYTDTEWFTIPQFAVKRIKYLPTCVYRYLLGREDQTMNPKVLARSVNSNMILARNMVSAVNQNKGKYPSENYEVVFNRTVQYVGFFYCRMMTHNEETLKTIAEFDQWLQRVNPSMYDRLQNAKYSNKFPVHFVKLFRKGTDMVEFRLMRWFYGLFHRGRE